MDFYEDDIPLSYLKEFTISENLGIKKNKLDNNEFNKTPKKYISNEIVSDPSNKENNLDYSPTKQTKISFLNKSNSELSLEKISNHEMPYTVTNLNEINIDKYLDNAAFLKKMVDNEKKQGEENKKGSKENIDKKIPINNDEPNINNNTIKRKTNIYKKKKKNRTLDYEGSSLISDLFSDTNSENKNVMVSELDIPLTNDELKQEYNSNTVNENNMYKIKNNEYSFKKKIELNIKQFLKQNLEEKIKKQKNNYKENNGSLTERNTVSTKKKSQLNRINKITFKKNIPHNLPIKHKVNAIKNDNKSLILNRSAANNNGINKRKSTLKGIKNRINFNIQDNLDENRKSFIYRNKNNKVILSNMKQNTKNYNSFNYNYNFNSNFNSNNSHKIINERFNLKNTNKSKTKNNKINSTGIHININKGNISDINNHILTDKNRHRIYENMLTSNFEPKIYYKNKLYFTQLNQNSELKQPLLKQKIKVKQFNLMNESLNNRRLSNKENKKILKNPIYFTKKLSDVKNINSAKKFNTENEDDNPFIYYKKIITVNKNSKYKNEK